MPLNPIQERAHDYRGGDGECNRYHRQAVMQKGRLVMMNVENSLSCGAKAHYEC